LFEALSALNAAPPILGFGIGTPGQVREALASGAAGVISGSALVGRVAAGDSPKALSKLVSELKAATRR
jgi:tryptophan synthase alpha chain